MNPYIKRFFPKPKRKREMNKKCDGSYDGSYSEH